jgi:hypothetical protein
MDLERLQKDRDGLLFNVRRSVRYHSRRRQFFDRYRLFTSAVSAIFGSAAIASVLSSAGKEYTVAAGACVTFFSILDLVIGSARMARLHEELYRRFIELEKQLIAIPIDQFTEENLQKFTASRLEIEADEPPIKRVLDSLVYNELARAMGVDKKYFIYIKWYQRLFAQMFSIGESTLHRYVDRQPS